MESQPQNPEFRINPENFHPCRLKWKLYQLIICLKIHQYQPITCLKNLKGHLNQPTTKYNGDIY